MGWRIDFTAEARRQFNKLDRQQQQRISRYLDALLADCDDPRQRGQGMTANHSGLWRYRVGDYRLLCRINDGVLTVLVLRIGHRSVLYD